MWGKNTKDSYHLTTDNFKGYLALDGTLVHFFNKFLSLPSFPERLQYSQESGLFEVVSDAADCVSWSISAALLQCKSKPSSNDPSALAGRPPVDNRYTVCCLDKEQGMNWIIDKRLPLFVESDWYFEYRLCKLLYHNQRINSNSEACLSSSELTDGQGYFEADSRTEVAVSELDKKTQEERSPPKCNATSRCKLCIPHRRKSNPSSTVLDSGRTQKPENTPNQPVVYVTEGGGPSDGDQSVKHSESQDAPASPVEDLASRTVERVISDAIKLLENPGVTNGPVASHRSPLADQGGDRGGSSSGDDLGARLAGEAEDQGRGSSRGHLGFLAARCHGTAQGLEDFKEFLQGTPGEKLLHLWIDIERLTSLMDSERKNRHLVQMRSRYVLSGGRSGSLSVEVLSRLGLSTTPCWREEKLRLVQPRLAETLGCYWFPRFWLTRCLQLDRGDNHLGLGTRKGRRPSSGIDPYPRYITLHPLRPHTCQPRHLNTAKSKPGKVGSLSGSSSSSSSTRRGPVLGGRRMETMLQALHVDSQAGLYFTGFCESSGNQLWKNAVHFWHDLQLYHQLFYEDGLDPYRVQRQAQLLYSTYLCSVSRRCIGVGEKSRREVYHCLVPAFEELFDGVEEHTLLLLLDPWTQLTTRDRDSYQRVCVREEVRQVDSTEYQELLILYEESLLRLEEQAEPSPPATPEGPREPDVWSNVPDQYRGYRLGSLLRHRDEIQHFLSFLQDYGASIHLSCWLDLEQYKRTPQRDRVLKDERSSSLKTTYLNRKYLFGPASPASPEQQEDLLRLVGGWERLQHNRVPGSVVGETQNVVRSYIEKTWLPLFLATPEFTHRQKHMAGDRRTGDRRSDQTLRRTRKKKGAWKKADGLWMSSTKEIMVFRRVLLDPVTCLQFQHFASLKGSSLENDVLFWLEVQRYKDLCHSHCNPSTVQQKVSTIIGCFINSSIPPALRIDISRGQADSILHQGKALGPYVFREAQMSVFGELLKLWPQFQAFKASVRDEEVLPLLEHRRLKHRAKAMRRATAEDDEEEEDEEDQGDRPQDGKGSRLEELLEEEEDEEEGGKKDDNSTFGRKSREQHPQVSWSYSKYMLALQREQIQQEHAIASFSTLSDSSCSPSLKTVGSRDSRQSHRSALSTRKQTTSFAKDNTSYKVL